MVHAAGDTGLSVSGERGARRGPGEVRVLSAGWAGASRTACLQVLLRFLGEGPLPGTGPAQSGAPGLAPRPPERRGRWAQVPVTVSGLAGPVCALVLFGPRVGNGSCFGFILDFSGWLSQGFVASPL